MSILSMVSILSISPCIAGFLTPQEVSALPSKPADHRLFYGNEAAQFGELRLPSGPGPHPVAIVIHGGCWISKFAGLENTAALADALRDLGVATWNIEYRRADEKGGGWPGTFLDVAHAADYLKKIAHSHCLDLNRVIAMGHSAGGHLALWLGARHRLSPKSELFLSHPLQFQGIISLGGVPDLRAFRQKTYDICGEDIIGRLTNEHFQDTSPIELLPLCIPQILIYGAQDQVVPTELGRAYVRAAQQAGDDSVELIEVHNAAHHEYNAPSSSTWPTIRSAVFALFEGCLSSP